MKPITILALATFTQVGNAQQTPVDELQRAALVIEAAATDGEAAANVIRRATEAADVLLAGHDMPPELWLFLKQGENILTGVYGDVPGSTEERIANALVAASIQNPMYKTWAYDLERAGNNGFDGAGDALLRVHAGLREHGHEQDAQMVIYQIGRLPRAQLLRPLSKLARLQGAEYVLEAMNAMRLLATVGGDQGIDALIRMDEAGTLNREAMRRGIRFNALNHADAICEAVPELSECVMNARLMYSNGHPPDYSVWDYCDSRECADAHHAEWKACADAIEESETEGVFTYRFQTEEAEDCRDDAMLRLFERKREDKAHGSHARQTRRQ